MTEAILLPYCPFLSCACHVLVNICHYFVYAGVRPHDALDVLQSRLELETDETQAQLRTLFGQRRAVLDASSTDAELVTLMVELMALHLPVEVVEPTTQQVREVLACHRERGTVRG